MKSLRKSLQRDSSNGHFSNNSISGPLPSVSKPVAAVVPPKAVIRASADHRPTTAMELAFSKGDFFYVIREVNEGGAWYEAHNPLSGARGLVPRALFEEFSKNTAGRYVISADHISHIIDVSPVNVPSPRSLARVHPYLQLL
jgi:bud emergence protein 1